MTSASRYVKSASRYQSRSSMYIRGLILRNSRELADADPIGLKQTIFTDKKTIYKVGDEVRLAITLRNGYNQTRSRGGDQLRVRVFNTSLQAYAAGYVKDHNNGTYTAFIRTYWPGQQTISVILAYRREAVRALYYKRTQVSHTTTSVDSTIIGYLLHLPWPVFRI